MGKLEDRIRASARRRRPGSPRAAPYDPDAPLFIATHEAGHAVSAIALDLELRSVDIKRRQLPGGGAAVGYADCQGVLVHEVMGVGTSAKPHIIQCMTGPFAELRVNPAAMEYDEFKGDIEAGRHIAAVAAGLMEMRTPGRLEPVPAPPERNRAEFSRLVRESTQEAASLVDAYRSAISRVAVLLLERKELTGDEVRVIVQEYPPEPAWTSSPGRGIVT